MLLLKEINSNYETDLRVCLSEYKICVIRNQNLSNIIEFYTNLANSIGNLAPMDEDLNSGNKNGGLFTEIKNDLSNPNSFRHSNTNQPLHTDGSYEKNAPSISFLFCLAKAKQGGETIFIDSKKVVEKVLEYSQNLYDQCMTVPINFAKGNDCKFDCIFKNIGDDFKLTWNYYRATSKNEAELNLIKSFNEFLEFHIVKEKLCINVDLNVGDGVFFHDELLLHGRNAFVGNRHLLKGGLWMK